MKIEITDAMVERAVKAARERNPLFHESTARKILEAALTEPPAEPEIVVTPDMARAGVDVWGDWIAGRLEHLAAKPDYQKNGGMVGVIYRAMRALEPKPAAKMMYWRSFDSGGGSSGQRLAENERSGKERRSEPQGYRRDGTNTPGRTGFTDRRKSP